MTSRSSCTRALLQRNAAMPLDPRLTGEERALRVVPTDRAVPGRGDGDVHVGHDLGAEAGLPDPRQLGGERRRLGAGARLDLNERWLCVMPLAHVGGLSILLRSTLYATTVVLHERFDTEAVLAELMDPASGGHARLAGADDARPAARRRPRAPADAAVGAARRRPDSAGRCSSVRRRRRAGGADLRDDRGLLADRDLRRAAARRRAALRGEVRSSSAARTSRRSTLDPDGWLHTGDLGELDQRGRLRIIGRSADTIVSGGENVAPAEVEAVLMEHPAVADAGVFAPPGRGVGGAGRRDGRAAGWPAGQPSRASGVCRRAARPLQGAEGDRLQRSSCRARSRESCCGGS